MAVEIVGIYISPVPIDFEKTKKPKGGFPMVSLEAAELVEGKGIRSLEGIEDRYFGDHDQELCGAYPNNKVRQLTVITLDAIERANKKSLVPFTWAETRRNIIVAGMTAETLNNLLYGELLANSAKIGGDNLSDPCDRPGSLLTPKKKGFKDAFTNEQSESMGGLRGRILQSGVITLGTPVYF